tara:strand:+ start:12768 stop:13058 length:291 start_codon:yes stop_codon:yes gene_type:complete
VTVNYHHEAFLEQQDAAFYYERQQAGLGDEFQDDIDEGLDRIEANPSGFKAVSGEYRKCISNRFRYEIIYQIIDENTIFIQAIVDSRRSPNHWQKR